VIGQTESQATEALQSAGFAVVIDKVPSSTAQAGTVTAQSPSAGVLAQPGSSVTIVVSTGPPTAPPTASPTP
ncbi:MAG TPA: PASTA domain-containing protein, partial [Thermoleophilia bacterium]|nr:PASTA domain-containing protein [Thermoleophilia bacterium]